MVLVGLGSNQGESHAIIVAAMGALGCFALPGTLRRSSLWRTSPVDCPPGSGDFINAAVAFGAVAGLTPEKLLSELKELEHRYGRQAPRERNAPRELDLDLLLFNGETRGTETITLPHPRAHRRLFVLAPANEVVPGQIWPGLGKSTEELLAELETDERVEPLELVH